MVPEQRLGGLLVFNTLGVKRSTEKSLLSAPGASSTPVLGFMRSLSQEAHFPFSTPLACPEPGMWVGTGWGVGTSNKDY